MTPTPETETKPNDRKRIRAEIQRLGPWFHNLHLPDGSQTAPNHDLGDFPRFKWESIEPLIPEDLSGWTALDVGCNAGYYSFELARRGARVVGIDHDDHYLRQARWAAGHFDVDDRVEFRRQEVYDLGRTEGKYDLVLFLGVLYHLRYPLLGLDAVARRVRRLMVFQSLTMPGEGARTDTDGYELDERDELTSPGWPRMAFLEHELAGDPTNWWAPNAACVQAMLRSTGMEVIASPEPETYLCRPGDEDRFWCGDQLRAALGAGSETPAGRP